MLGRFLRWKRGGIALTLVIGAVLIMVFLLYSLPMEALKYTLLVLSVLLAAGLTAAYGRMKRRAEQLTQTRMALEAGDTRLPEARGYPEEDWREIAQTLKEQLVIERKRAERAMSETAEYYTTWAHQIKTPISAIRLSLQDEDTPAARTALKELTRVEQYAEMALTFARLDAPSTDYVFRSCALDDVLRRAIRRFSGEFIARRLRLNFEESGAQAVTDEKWLGFVVEQILANALKYTREGEISVGVEDGECVVVRDTGIGIAPEDLPRVFEKGYTGFNGRVDERASGIGLYLCRRVCQRLGAKITVNSLLGKGTTVRVDLSREKASGD